MIEPSLKTWRDGSIQLITLEKIQRIQEKKGNVAPPSDNIILNSYCYAAPRLVSRIETDAQARLLYKFEPPRLIVFARPQNSEHRVLAIIRRDVELVIL